MAVVCPPLTWTSNPVDQADYLWTGKLYDKKWAAQLIFSRNALNRADWTLAFEADVATEMDVELVQIIAAKQLAAPRDNAIETDLFRDVARQALETMEGREAEILGMKIGVNGGLKHGIAQFLASA